jgi:type II secretory ATPase GspE/PulE/Tfp pilus assembly ATPase PilB-like protein
MAKNQTNANWQAGLEFALGNLGTLIEYIREGVSAKTLEAEQAALFLDGPYIDWLKTAQAKAARHTQKDLHSAFLDADRVLNSLVRLLQLEYCAKKDTPLRNIDFWDFENFKWLEEALPEYHPVHHELKELMDSMRPDLGDKDLSGLLILTGKAEKETFRFQARSEASEQIEGLQSELSGKLDDIVKAQEDEDNEPDADLPIVDLAEAILADGALRGATEIEIVPGPWRGLVQYRIEDQDDFSPILELPPEVTRVIVIRLKIIANLDITNSMEPQDGRIEKIPAPCLVGKSISLATTPTAHKEKALIRLD